MLKKEMFIKTTMAQTGLKPQEIHHMTVMTAGGFQEIKLNTQTKHCSAKCEK